MTNNKYAYSQKLLDPRWQKKRLEVFQRDDFSCQTCGSKDKTLHVHHKFYEYGKAPWDYDSNSLITLCAECHEMEGGYKNDLHALIKQLLIDGYTYEHLCQHLSGLQIPLEGFDCEQRVQLASFCAVTPEILTLAQETIDTNWNSFLAEIECKDRRE